MKVFFYMTYMLTVASTCAQAELYITEKSFRGYRDVILYQFDKPASLQRSIVLEAPNGKSYLTQRRYLILDHSTLQYIPGSSSAETLEYLKAVCQLSGGGKPVDRMVVMSFQSSFAMLCDH